MCGVYSRLSREREPVALVAAFSSSSYCYYFLPNFETDGVTNNCCGFVDCCKEIIVTSCHLVSFHVVMR